jgi:lysophospholipase L1-like esterase
MRRRPSLVLSFLPFLLGFAFLSIWPASVSAEQIKATIPAPQTASWWSARHARAVARIQQGPVDLLFIGDSITQGWEEDGRRVWDTFYGRRRAVNLGFNSDQTDNVLWRLQHGEIDGIAPKLAIVMIGTNNTTVREDPPEQTAAGIHAILTTLRTRLPQTKILLLAVFPRGASANDPTAACESGRQRTIAGLRRPAPRVFPRPGPAFSRQGRTTLRGGHAGRLAPQ